MTRPRLGSVLLASLLMLVLSPPGLRAAQPETSGVVRVEISGTEALPALGPRQYRRLFGVIYGVVRADESIAGLGSVTTAGQAVPYSAAFELISPTVMRPDEAVVVEAENRGKPAFLSLLSDLTLGPSADPRTSAYPHGFGNAFPFRNGVSYARVQWQVGISPDVPSKAQGVGEAIVRDFGRLLAGQTERANALPIFQHRVLIGVSQSAWFVNAFVAEGFNRDPATGKAVFQGAFTRNGAGNLLAINTAAHGGAQSPYVAPNGVPLTPRQLLRRPVSDPLLVDVTSYTDFYRVRASVFAEAPAAIGLWRYDVVAPHAPANPALAALAFGGLGCNGGKVVPLDRTNDAPVLRALLLKLLQRTGASAGGADKLPASRQFALAPVSPVTPINILPGTRLRVPRRAANGTPAGGVRTLEAELPLGVPEFALPPLSTASIAAVCGNFGEWRPFGPAELKRRYGSLAMYMQRARRTADRLRNEGFLLREDNLPVLRNLEQVASEAGLH